MASRAHVILSTYACEHLITKPARVGLWKVESKFTFYLDLPHVGDGMVATEENFECHGKFDLTYVTLIDMNTMQVIKAESVPMMRKSRMKFLKRDTCMKFDLDQSPLVKNQCHTTRPRGQQTSYLAPATG